MVCTAWLRKTTILPSPQPLYISTASNALCLNLCGLVTYVLAFSQLFVASPWSLEVQCSSEDSKDEGDLLAQAGLLPTYTYAHFRVSQHNQ